MRVSAGMVAAPPQQGSRAGWEVLPDNVLFPNFGQKYTCMSFDRQKGKSRKKKFLSLKTKARGNSPVCWPRSSLQRGSKTVPHSPEHILIQFLILSVSVCRKERRSKDRQTDSLIWTDSDTDRPWLLQDPKAAMAFLS